MVVGVDSTIISFKSLAFYAADRKLIIQKDDLLYFGYSSERELTIELRENEKLVAVEVHVRRKTDFPSKIQFIFAHL